LSGTSQNVVGIVIAGLATFGAQILLTRTLGAKGFGVVTVATQGAFVTSFATRAGMDMAALRDVAVESGQGRWERIRAPVARAVAIAAGVSVAFAAVGALGSDWLARAFSMDPQQSHGVFLAASLGLPFLALTNVWLGATRGLKLMRYTLYVFWAGQPIAWLALMAIALRISKTPVAMVLAYSLSWILASAAAFVSWRRESGRWQAAPMEPGDLSRLVRYAGPRAPAALASQLLFWTDLFVLTRFVSPSAVGVYSAALRVGQIVVLFLTSVNLMFSPFVADLHNRRETERLDRLFKTLTRWTVAVTIPAFLLLAVAPASALRIFGGAFAGGETALLILLAGQFVNILTGSCGFVLIMAGYTGWDLVVLSTTLVLDVILAFILCSFYGIEGAAIANACAFAGSNLAQLLLVKRFVGIQPFDRQFGRLLAPAAVGFAAMALVHHLLSGGWLVNLVATGIVGGVVYAGLYLSIGVTPSERAAGLGIVRRIRSR
jgi:O-antigen/teichoic acid export membrane protein